MVPPRWFHWTLGALVLAAVLARALAVYTFPSDRLGIREIRSAIGTALGQPGSPLRTPATLRAFPAAGALRPSLPSALADERRFARFPAEPSISGEVRDWARAAAAANPAALRRWLTARQVTTTRASLDTTYVISRRLSVGEGCPAISTLRAAFYQDLDGLHLVSLASDCPRPAGAADAR
jgi:hypothetical protein